MAINNILNAPFPLSPTKGGLGVASPTAHGILIAEGSSAATPIVLTAGQVLIGTTASDPIGATITAGSGISITSNSGSITITSLASSYVTWSNLSGTSQTALINNGYVIGNASLTTVTLPAVAPLGSIFAIQGKGAGGWVLQCTTGQVINYGNSPTSSTGSLASTNQFDCVQIICITANTTFAVMSSIGNLTVA